MPKLPRKPLVDDPAHQKWINHVHALLESLPAKQTSAPSPPSGIQVVPGPGMNRIAFTGGQGADSHLILSSPNRTWNPTLPDNHVIDIGRGTTFPHIIGIGGKQLYYWVVAVKNGLKSDPPVGPVGGMTLALNAPLVPPTAVKVAPGNVVEDSSGQPTLTLPGLTRGGRKP